MLSISECTRGVTIVKLVLDNFSFLILVFVLLVRKVGTGSHGSVQAWVVVDVMLVNLLETRL